MKLKFFALLSVVVAISLTSCNHKDLCYMDMDMCKLRVVYDWSDAPDATANGMCVFFYSLDDPNAYYRFDFDNTQGGEISLPAGRYKLITYNNDTEAVRFSATNDFDNHTAYTRDGDLLEPLYGNGVTSNATTTNGERVCITPDGLWGCQAYDVVVDFNGVKYTYVDSYYESRACNCMDSISKDQIITLYPHDMLCHYTFEVRHVENAQYVSKISASISGMSPTMNMSTESTGSENITLPLSAKADTEAHNITGQFLTFGQNGSESVAHKMSFFVVMNDGSKYRVEGSDNLDVTSQVDNAPDKRHVHIIIDHIKLPGPGVEAGDWYFTVDDWGVHEEDLPV